MVAMGVASAPMVRPPLARRLRGRYAAAAARAGATHLRLTWLATPSKIRGLCRRLAVIPGCRLACPDFRVGAGCEPRGPMGCTFGSGYLATPSRKNSEGAQAANGTDSKGDLPACAFGAHRGDSSAPTGATL